MTAGEQTSFNHDAFIQEMQETLAVASTSGDFNVAVQNGNSVLLKLEQVAKGELVVEPPLSENEKATLAASANLAVSLGEKAIEGIRSAEETAAQSRRGWFARRRAARAAGQAAAAVASFNGPGSSAKSW